MKTFDLYKERGKCCGCEACVQVCPKGVVSMQADAEGFFYPIIKDESNCINCGRCVKVCPIKTSFKTPAGIISSYGGYCKKDDDIKHCASGGFAFSLSKVFLEKGGIVYGVRYSEDFRDVKFARCEDYGQLLPTRASKYVQARKYEIFKEVKADLINKKKVLFFGLPCEIAALYHFLGNKTDELYTVNLICHGPTSIGVHNAFIDQVLKTHEKSCIIDFSVRYKKDAWKPYYVHIVFEDGSELLDKFVDTDYGTAFQQLKRPSCAKCRFKVYDKEFGMPADLTIGDYHLAHKGMIQYNHWGSSQVSVHSDKGAELVELVGKSVNLYPITEYNAVHYNTAFFRSIHIRWNRFVFSSEFQKKGLSVACEHWSVKVIDNFVNIKRIVKTSIANIVRKIK